MLETFIGWSVLIVSLATKLLEEPDQFGLIGRDNQRSVFLLLFMSSYSSLTAFGPSMAFFVEMFI